MSQKGLAPLIIIVVVLVLAGIGAGAYYLTKQIPFISGPKQLLELPFTGIPEGPGGCRGQECQDYCARNQEECTKWCLENEEICSRAMGGGKPVPPVTAPKTKITYPKSFNIFLGADSVSEIKQAKALGANMVTLWPPTRTTDKNEVKLMMPLENLSQLVVGAHKAGLQVEIRNTFPADNPATATSVQEFTENAKVYVAEVAQFAEKYHVYRITPFAEIDNNLFGNEAKVTQVAQELLAEAREHYQGKVGIGIAAPWREANYNFSGYDFLEVSVYPKKTEGVSAFFAPPEEVSNPAASALGVIAGARKVAQRSDNLPLYIAETGVFNPGEETITAFQAPVISKEAEADYYQRFFEETKNLVDGYAIYYGGQYMNIKDDPAEKVVKEWFSRL